jgi:hypothetical protein
MIDRIALADLYECLFTGQKSSDPSEDKHLKGTHM